VLDFEVFVAVAMKSGVFWDIMPCTLPKVIRRFEGTYRLYIQDRRVRQAGNQYEAGFNAL
jgi:hypothetical protein